MSLGRPPKFKKVQVVSIRIPDDDYFLVQEIAMLEREYCGRKCFGHDLIRDAIKFVFRDNENMREMFRRNREELLSKNLWQKKKKKSC